MLVSSRRLLLCLFFFASLSTSRGSEVIGNGSEQAYHMVARVGHSNARRQNDAVCQARFDCHTGRLKHDRLTSDTYPYQAFVDMDQTISNDCRSAPIYKIAKGNLSTTINDVEYHYTTSSGVASQLFVPSTTLGNITQSFMLGVYGAIVWRNAAFDNGQAQFCSTYDGSIYAVFQTAAMPDGCTLTSLYLFGASSCADLEDRVSTLVQTQSTFLVSTQYRIVVSTEPRTITTTEREVSTYLTTYERTITSTYWTYLDGTTVTATYQTTLPASTAYIATTQPASTPINTATMTYITTTLRPKPHRPTLPQLSLRNQRGR